MSQTTRCPSCATLFKVVADQLRISDGWVRCGHCKQVFDASQSLQTVAAESLMPDMPLDQLRAPSQPVGRTTEVPKNWGDEYAEHSDIASSPVQARDLTTPAAVRPHDFAQQALHESMLHVPKPGVPAFLVTTDPFERDAKDAAADSEKTPSFAWSGLPSSVPAPEDADDWPDQAWAHAFNGGSMPAEAGKPTGYELPAPVLPESDVDWLEEGVEPQPEPEITAEVAAEAETGPAEPLRQSESDDADADDAPSSHQVGGQTTGASVSDWQNSALVGEPEHLDAQQQEEVISDAVSEPSFVRAARRQALWHKPAVRAVLGLLVLVLTAALLLQMALQQRNYLAAAWPQLRPYLEMACAPLQCRVDTYREISSVVVDSSSFDKLRGNAYQFVITLQNRSGLELEMPAVELTLTDAGDQPVLRRVFTVSDLSAPATLSARGEWAVTLPIQLAPSDSARIAGYRVLAFYP